MRHSPASRSLVNDIGRRVRLADRAPARPRHAGPLAAEFGPSRPHRVLRLAMVVGMTGAGFCLVLAMIALVVTLGGPAVTSQGPGRSAPRPPAAGQRAVTGAARRPDRLQPGQTIARYRSSGSARHEKFTVTGQGILGISWKFACQGRRAGTFTVSESDSEATRPGIGRPDTVRPDTVRPDPVRPDPVRPDTGRPEIVRLALSASGPRGQGLSWDTYATGVHSLMVSSNCSWDIRIVRPKR
jgi:hypothetical protein